MNTNLQIFEFESQTIRTVEIDGEVWFVAKNVADILGHSQLGHALRMVDDEDKLLITNKNPLSGSLGFVIPDRGMYFINESGLYTMVLNSRREDAKRFKKWVTSEVLPTIRKTGQYQMPTLKTPITAGQMFMEVAKQFLVFEEKLFALESSHKRLEDRVDEITPTKGYLTITAFLKKYHIQMEFKDRQALGLHATQVCRERNLFIDKIPDARYGSVGAYPEEVLVELMEIEI